MIKGKTKSGFAFEVNEEMIKDARFLDLLTAMESNLVSDGDKMRVTFDLLNLLLGTAGKNRLYAHVEHDGLVDSEIVGSELGEILKAVFEKGKAAKKSSPLPE